MERIDRGRGIRTALRGTLLAAAVTVGVLGSARIGGAGGATGTTTAPGAGLPAPAAFLAAGAGDRAAPLPEAGVLTALLEAEGAGGVRLSPPPGPRREDSDASPPAAASPPPRTVPPGEEEPPMPRAEVIARLEGPGGRTEWLLRTGPDGRFLRAAAAPASAAAPAPAPADGSRQESPDVAATGRGSAGAYLEEREGRVELVVGGRRYLVSEPPWDPRTGVRRP